MNNPEINVEARERILALFEAKGELFTFQVEKELGLSKAKTIYYLNALAAEGKLEKQRIGRQIIQWKLRKEA